jgi:hypothetical protein
MRDSRKRFLIHLSISALAALATPAIAAGLVIGTGQVFYVADSSTPGIATASVPTDQAPAANRLRENYATHEPARLSPLAGNDKAAWDSAHAVHVQFKQKPASPDIVAIR